MSEGLAVSDWETVLEQAKRDNKLAQMNLKITEDMMYLAQEQIRKLKDE